ncbi:hypothetical protein G9A89_015786 [Geosiphon pyriformis]|nr:hypothetical protein G9A89_015786 [Geosiphon pyriformis]
MKKTIKASGSEGGFKTVASRKKRKRGVLKENIDNKETGDTTESESINIEEECLVEETSIDYDDNGTFTGEDPDQTPKGLHVKTKKVLGKPLGMIDYDTVNAEDDMLDDFFFLPPSLPIKPSKKVNFVKKIFSGAMMAAAQLANDCSVVINTNLKCPINNCINQAIVLKEILVRTSIEAVRAAISEFGFIKSIKMQLADLLAAEWSIFIGKDVVRVAQADVDKQTWDARDEFRALLYTLLMGTNAYNL